MALSNRDFRLIGITMLTTAVVAVAFTTYYWEHTVLPPSDEPVSERVKWEEAYSLMRKYREFDPLYVKYPDPDRPSDSIIDVLQGFVFEPTHLREIIANNSSEDGNPDEVVFYIGQHGTFIRPEDGITYPNLSLIAVGERERQILINRIRPGKQASLFDKADPCPPNCPD